MAYAVDPGALLTAVSGVAIAALGAVALRIHPRTPASVAFSAFALLWGAEIVAANVSLMALDVATARPWVYLFQALIIPVYLPLLVFAAAHTSPAHPLVRRPVVFGAAALPALFLELLFLAEPRLFVADVVLQGGFVTTIPGPLFDPVSQWNNLLAFVVALGVVWRKLRRSTGDVARSQLALLAAALLAYVSYRSASLAADYALATASWLTGGAPTFALLVAIAAAGLAASVGVAAGAARDRAVPWRDVLLACGTIPLVAGVAEVLIAAQGVSGFSTLGAWRLVMAGLLAYAIARYRMFDVELRLHDAVPAATFVLASLVAVAALWSLAGGVLARTPVLALAATAGSIAACAPLARLGRRAAAGAAPQVATADYLYRRKLDMYRAAVEEAEAAGAGQVTEQAFLEDLRRRLGISEKEHQVILLMLEWQQRQPRPLAAAGGDRYRVERELGRGGFARAVLASDSVLDRQVVLKQPHAPWAVDEEGRSRFLQEARLAGRLRHPNVVTVYEVLPDATPPVLVLEYVPGGSLADLLESRGPLPPPEALRIFEDVLAGVEAIHREGIVHRDLKPANILLDADGRAKITDFGIARPPAGMALAATLAGDGDQAGSVPYMSPEQVQGGDVDGRSDLYSAAVVLYEMLTRKSYLGLDELLPPEGRRLILAARPHLPAPGIPPRLVPVLEQALSKDASRRPAAAGEFRSAVRAALAAPAAAPAKPRTRK